MQETLFADGSAIVAYSTEEIQALVDTLKVRLEASVLRQTSRKLCASINQACPLIERLTMKILFRALFI